MQLQPGDLGVLRRVIRGFSEEARSRSVTSLILVRSAFGKLEPLIGNIVQMVQLSIGRNSYASRQSTCRTDV